jgi:hypothetical protein
VGGHKERGNEDEYGGNILYPYMKIEELPVDIVLRRGKRKNNGGGKSN